MHRTEPNHRQNPGPAHDAADINLLVSYGVSWSWALQWLALVRTWLRCVVIGSGAQVAMVAAVDNASGIGKAFRK